MTTHEFASETTVRQQLTACIGKLYELVPPLEAQVFDSEVQAIAYQRAQQLVKIADSATSFLGHDVEHESYAFAESLRSLRGERSEPYDKGAYTLAFTVATAVALAGEPGLLTRPTKEEDRGDS